MIKLYSYFLAMLIFSIGHGQTYDDTDPFPNMISLEFSSAKVKFFSENFDPEIIECNQLPQSNPLSCEGGPRAYLLGNYSFDGERIMVGFTEGLSDDPEFLFYSKRGKFIKGISGTELYLSANGFFYVTGTANDFFKKKRKFQFKKGEVIEIEQPFYYIGLTTKTLNTVELYQSKELKSKVATLPANYDVELLLVEPGYDDSKEIFVLVRTKLGLVGWVKLDPFNYNDMSFDGFYFHGD